MWQRFTERARRVVFYAQEEAGKLGENYVSTEHLLLGLVREHDSVAARVLDRLGVSLERVRKEIERQVVAGDGRLGQDMQLTPRAKRIIDLSYDEARQLGNSHIGTEHLLLGLIREGEGLAGRVLSHLGMELYRTRAEVIKLQEGGKEKEPLDLSKTVGVDAPMVRLAHEILVDAIGQKAKAVSVASWPDNVTVQHQIGGVWKDAGTFPKHIETPLVSQFKNMAGLDAAIHDREQTGRFLARADGQTFALVLTCRPGPDGETVTVQIGDLAPPPKSSPSQRMAPPRGRSELADVLHEHRLRGRDIIGIEQLTRDEILLILDVAARLKANKFDATQTQFAQGQTLAMLFEKPSLRTRVTFEAGMTQLGGHAIYLEGRLGVRETVPDVARNLDRWIDGIMARTFDHQTVLDLAENAGIPVINGLSDREHPCQALADFQTLQERKGKLEGLKLAYVGDGNNVAHSLALAAAKLGTHFSLACPEGYEPDAELWQAALGFASVTGAVLTLTHDSKEGVADADAVYTDVWASMGQEEEAAERAKAFAAFQVNAELVAGAKPDALIMHCLPAHRGEEISADVLDGPNSVVFDQAENRLHAQKAVLALVL